MNFDLSRQGPFATILFLVLLIFVFWTSSLSVQPIEIPALTPLEQWIDNQLINSPAISQLISAILIFVTAIAVARLTIRSVIFMERSYLPALVYLVISAGYYSSLYTLRPLLAALMLAHATKWILRSYSRKGVASGDYVVAGFWFSTAILVFTPSIVTLPMLFVGLVMFRFWDLREWIAAIAGLLFPFIASVIICQFSGVDLANVGINIVDEMRFDEGIFAIFKHVNLLQWTFFGVIFVLFILAITNFFMRRKSFSSKPYLSYLYFIWFAFVSVLLSLLIPTRTIYLLPIIALPLAILLPSYFNGRKATFLSNFLYAMFIVTAIAISMLPLIIMSLR